MILKINRECVCVWGEEVDSAWVGGRGYVCIHPVPLEHGFKTFNSLSLTCFHCKTFFFLLLFFPFWFDSRTVEEAGVKEKCFFSRTYVVSQQNSDQLTISMPTETKGGKITKNINTSSSSLKTSSNSGTSDRSSGFINSLTCTALYMLLTSTGRWLPKIKTHYHHSIHRLHCLWPKTKKR